VEEDGFVSVDFEDEENGTCIKNKTIFLFGIKKELYQRVKI